MAEDLQSLLAKAATWGRDRALYAKSRRADEQRSMAEFYSLESSWLDDARSMTQSANIQKLFTEAAAKAFRDTLAKP